MDKNYEVTRNCKIHKTQNISIMSFSKPQIFAIEFKTILYKNCHIKNFKIQNLFIFPNYPVFKKLYQVNLPASKKAN